MARGGVLGSRNPVAPAPTVPADLSRDRRRRSAELSSDLAKRVAGQEPAQNVFTLGERKMPKRPIPRFRSHPPGVPHESLDRLGRAAHGGRRCGERFARRNSALHLETVRFRQPMPVIDSLPHPTSSAT
jgi:hypothetical protein